MTTAGWGAWYGGRRVLVVGGLGFIGAHLSRRVLALGAACTIVTPNRSTHDADAAALERAGARVVEGDLRDATAMLAAVDGQVVVFNLSGRSGAVRSMEDPLTDLDVNCRGNLVLLEAVRSVSPAAKVVFPGSRLEYGRPGSIPVAEHEALDPLCVHAVHKIAVESYLKIYRELYGLRSTVLRITNPFGPGQPAGRIAYGVVNRLIHLALENRPLPIFGDGRQLRDYIYIDDTIDALLAVGAAPTTDGRAYNVGSGVGTAARRHGARHHRAGRRRKPRVPAVARACGTDRNRRLRRRRLAECRQTRAGPRRPRWRKGCDGPSTPIASTRRLDGSGATGACVVSESRVHGGRRRGDGAQPGPPSPGSIRAHRLLHQPGGTHWRGNSKDRRAVSRAGPRARLRAAGRSRRHCRYLREMRPDIVHTFLLTASLYGRLAAILARVPIVIGTEVNIYEHKQPHHALAERLLMAGTDRVVVSAESVRDFYIRQVHADPAKVDVIYNAVDFDMLQTTVTRDEMRARIGVPADAMTAGVIARLTEQKGASRICSRRWRRRPARATPSHRRRRRRAARRARGAGREADAVVARAFSRRAPRPGRPAGRDGRLRDAVALGRPAAVAGAGDGRRPSRGGHARRRHPRGGPGRRDRRARAACRCAGARRGPRAPDRRCGAQAHDGRGGGGVRAPAVRRGRLCRRGHRSLRSTPGREGWAREARHRVSHAVLARRRRHAARGRGIVRAIRRLAGAVLRRDLAVRARALRSARRGHADSRVERHAGRAAAL